MIKLSDIPVEETPHSTIPGVLVIRPGLKLGCHLECQIKDREDTIQHGRQEIWHMMYGDLLKDLNEYTHFVLSRAPWTQTQIDELKQKTEVLLDKYTPE